MTTHKKRNHYNVKLLRGYGISISLKNSKIILKNGSHDVTGEQEKEEWFVNKMPYSKIVISGKGYISTESMSVRSSHHSLHESFQHGMRKNNYFFFLRYGIEIHLLQR